MEEEKECEGRVDRNAFIHMAYLRGDAKECLSLIEEQLRETKGLSEYPLYMKAVVLREEGRVQEALSLFQAATCMAPTNPSNLKQVARCLFLLGKHKAAIDVYNEAQRVQDQDDWEVWHNKGLCYKKLKQFEKAVDCLEQANCISRHDATYMALGNVYEEQGNLEAALETYRDALDDAPENTELLTTIGLLYLRLGDKENAFTHLGNSLTHNPRDPKTILAAGSIIQDNNDVEVALVKYRVAAVHAPNCPHLWSNAGMCFYGNKRYIAAIACLKRALYLDPFEWIICYNLGLVHLATKQYASAFQYLSSSINLKPDYAPSYMHLGVALAHLDDFDNACSAYEKALELEADHVTHLNYAVTLFNNDEPELAAEQFQQHEQLLAIAKEDPDFEMDEDVDIQRRLLRDAGL
ncbi:unnamed protein product [Chrysoparadoxa australica]